MARHEWDDVEKSMIGQWHDFLTTAGLPALTFNGKHQPCPLCGGKDRFRFDNNRKYKGDGGYICSQCGSGNGTNLYRGATGVGFVDMINDCASYLNLAPVERQIFNKKAVAINLPMGGEPHLDIEDTLKGCEAITEDGETKYFIKGAQVVVTTDLNSKPVSLAMIQGKGFSIRHYKKSFLYGSCAIFGDTDGKVILTSCWWQAMKLHYQEKRSVVCYFEPLNMHFIYQGLKQLTKDIDIHCAQIEDLYQAESFKDYVNWEGKRVFLSDVINNLQQG